MKHAISLLIATLLGLIQVAAQTAPAPTDKQRGALHWAVQEIEIARILDRLRAQSNSAPAVFRNVSVVDVAAGRSIPHQTVITRDGKVAWVGDIAREPAVASAHVIDGKGLFLAPGLTDMHVHTISLSEQLLRLATGETGARDMDGFPWMLDLRRAIRSGNLLAPDMYIAGTIIADQPLDNGYAVVVKTDRVARATVDDQKACGYDFIKVHNLLAQPLFDAIAEEAAKDGLDLVGHIPHDISIDHALHIGHMRTVEHLKGFLIDRTLIVSDEDYAKATAAVEYWQDPTLYTALGYLRGPDAEARMGRPETRYVALARREQWAKDAAQTGDRAVKLHELLVTAQHAAIQRLLPLHTHWLAGTDAADYDYDVAGYALLDEMNLMRDFGISNADVLRAATSEAAAAMHRNDFGRVAVGQRADLALLARDPARDVSAFRENRGVMVRGAWLDRPALDQALSELAKVEAEPDASFAVDAAAARDIAENVARLAQDHIALDDKNLIDAALALRALGYNDSARSIYRLAIGLETGPCAAFTPVDTSGDD